MMKKSLLLSLLIFVTGLSFVAAQNPPDERFIKTDILNGSATSLPKPVYPSAAKAVRAGGAVNVLVKIDDQGNVTEATAVSGHPLLRSAAEQAARSAKFKSPTVNINGVIVYNFIPPTLKNTDSERTEVQSNDSITTGRVVGSENGFASGTGNIVNQRAIELVKPKYPPAARAVRASGAVNVRVLIDEQGNVVSADAISGHPLLRASAVEAALQSRFKPTLLENQPVKVDGIIVFNFVP